LCNTVTVKTALKEFLFRRKLEVAKHLVWLSLGIDAGVSLKVAPADKKRY
jgi:hypothetical protein